MTINLNPDDTLKNLLAKDAIKKYLLHSVLDMTSEKKSIMGSVTNVFAGSLNYTKAVKLEDKKKAFTKTVNQLKLSKDDSVKVKIAKEEKYIKYTSANNNVLYVGIKKDGDPAEVHLFHHHVPYTPDNLEHYARRILIMIYNISKQFEQDDVEKKSKFEKQKKKTQQPQMMYARAQTGENATLYGQLMDLSAGV